MAYSKAEKAVLGEFGRRVRSAREAHGWSQEQLAEKAQLDRTYIGGVERGERNLALLNCDFKRSTQHFIGKPLFRKNTFESEE